MQFLTPLFLAGLAAIAVPLWFHLIRKEQAARVLFSSLMYVPPKEQELIRRQRLRHWPLFLLRSLLIVLMVLALSRPYWKNYAGGWSPASLARVVLLDNSLSMRAGSRWTTAQAAAEREIVSVPAGSELTLALVSDRVEMLSELGEASSALLAKLKRAEPTYRATRLDQGIQVAGDLLKQSRMGTREIVLISDFQKNGLHLSSWNIPQGVGLRTFTLPAAGTNLSIADVQISAVSYENAPSEDLIVRVQNWGTSEARDISVELRFRDQVVQTQRVAVVAKGAALAHFNAPDLESEPVVRLVLHLAVADSLAEDNWFFMTLRRQQKIPVVLAATGAARRAA
ncbi:MAG: BatA domain-containing protein, partial [Acidobacteria bacterium]|nr:BatA domain-containing protein [Acidobacteriota bacterium]